ncbi:extracellular calcium-sensing receptor-like [Cetorhinus maximus]
MGGIFHFHHHLVQQLQPPSFTVEPQSPECENFNLREFHLAQTMIFAIEEINRSAKLLPNVELGYKIYDGCSSDTLSVKAVMELISTQDKTTSDSNCTVTSEVPVIFADAGFIRSLAETILTRPFDIPTVSFSATCRCFGDLDLSTLLETIPSDSHQIMAITSLVRHFGWKWVGLVHSRSAGMAMDSEAMVRELQGAGVCLAFRETFSGTDPRERLLRVVDRVKRAATQVVVAFAAPADMEVLLREVVRQNVTGVQWIGSGSWVALPALTPADSLVGAAGFVIPKAGVPGLKEFLLRLHPRLSPGNPLLAEFWEETFRCSVRDVTRGRPGPRLRRCTGNERLQGVDNPYTDTSQLRVAYRVYRAVYAVAHALHSIFSCGNDTCPRMSGFKSWQTLKPMGMHSHKDGNWIQKYELVNRQISASGTIDIVTIGKYDTSEPLGQELKINEQDIVWTGGQKEVPRGICSESCPPGTRKAIRAEESICCFDCVQCQAPDISNVTDALFCVRCPPEYWPNHYRNECLLKEIEFLSFQDGIGDALTSFAVGGACLTIAMAVVFYKYRQTPLVRANNSELSFFMLLSLLLCFLSALPFSAQPTTWSCILRFTIFTVTFALCLSGILGKTMVVLLAFKTVCHKNNLVKWLNPRRQRMGVLTLTSIQCLICIFWITQSPPFPYKSLKHYPHVISLECQVGSVIYFCTVFMYIFLLAGVTLIVAFFARKLPNSFNEATHITFSLIVFLTVWATFFPVYVSASEKYAATVHAFAILASSFGLLLCIFAPKCYIILLKPEKNTRKSFMSFSSR